jgi:hypothetical protein
VKRFGVSILVQSPSLNLDELSQKLGRPHSSDSHTIGEPHRGGSAWSKTAWRFDSDASEGASVQDHLENLKARFPPTELVALLPADCTVSIDIAIFFDTANVSLSVPRRGMEIANSYNAALEVTCYPVEKQKP